MTPSLARRARLKWDPSRDAHVLLYPEGVLVLNDQAADVIALVDGARTVDGIVDALAIEHPDAPRGDLDADVRELLERLVQRGFVKVEP